MEPCYYLEPIIINLIITLTIGLMSSFNQSQNTNLDHIFTVLDYNAIHHGVIGNLPVNCYVLPPFLMCHSTSLPAIL